MNLYPRYVLPDLLYRLLLARRLARLRALRKGADARGWSLLEIDRMACLYVHVPKCAGVSVSQALFGNLGGGHIALREYRLLLGPADFRSRFRFGFVRNPWDRLFSSWRFLQRGGLTAEDAAWAKHELSACQGFEHFVEGWLNTASIYRYIHFVPQYHFLCLPGQVQHGLDILGRFETLQEDFARIAERLERPVTPGRDNAAPEREDYRQHYTLSMRRKVARIYREDIERFGYSFEG